MMLTMGQKAGWGLADMGIVVFVVVKQLLVLAYLTTVLGVPVEIAGLVTSGVLVFDIVTDPLVGYLSDRTNSRFGRRFPWMFVGALILALSMIGLFSVPEGASISLAVVWVLGFFGLATIGFTMVAVPYGAMAGEITQDAGERSAMTGWRMGFASVGILIGGALIPGLAAGMGYGMAAMVVSPLVFGPIWLAIFFTRRAPRIEAPSTVGFGDMLGLVFANKAFVTLVVLYGLMTFSVALITAGLPFAALYLILDNGMTALSGAASALTVLSLIFAAFVLGSILSQVVWVILSKRMGKVGALALGLGLYMIVLLAIYMALPSVNATALAGLFVLAGMTNGSYQQIPFAMYPDLMDVTRAETGEAIEGAFSAFWLFGQKVANALAPLVLALILGTYGWIETTQGVTEQLPEALGALHVSITLVPAVIFGIAIVALLGVYRPMAKRVLG